MKKWILISSMAIALSGCSLSATDEQPEYKAATGNGALRVHLDSIEKRVEANRSNEGRLKTYRLDSLALQDFESAYGSWTEIVIFSDDLGPRMAVLKGKDSTHQRLEEFHFGQDGELEYGLNNEEAPEVSSKSEYYFMLEKLVKARVNGEEVDLEKDSVKYRSILMVKKADELRKIAANKELKP